MYGVQLVLTLIILGGLIAYVGDKIGMKVGKKRLSLFGLRPKYTSIIITIITGILIALMSLGLLLVVSQNVRQALFDMQAVLEKLDNLQQTVQAKNQELTTLRDQVTAKSKELLTLEQDKEKLQTRLGKMKQEYKQVKDRKLQLETQVEELSLQQEALTDQVNNLAHNLSLFGKRYFHSLTEDLIFPKGEVVVSTRIAESNPAAKLEKLLATAKQEANQAGLGAGQVTYNQEEKEEAINLVTNRKEQMILRLVAAQNTFQDEELQLKFDLYPDYQVYEQGETIMTYQVEAEQLAQLEAELDQLVARLNQVAVQEGMLPDKQGQVVDFSLAQLYPLVDKLLGSETNQLKVVASQEVWRASNLQANIKLEVED
ncbi:DUF3084 domain-containing protein [Halanaerobaculum tunisiense]